MIEYLSEEEQKQIDDGSLLCVNCGEQPAVYGADKHCFSCFEELNG